MKKLIIFISTLFLIFTISFSQVKYTSAGNFGIGTLTPTNAILEIKPTTSGNGLLINCGNYDVDFGLGNGLNYGYFWRYKGSGSGNNNTLQLWTDGQTSTDVKVYEIYQDGNLDFYSPRIDLFSQSTADYAKTMVVYNKNRLLENYVVYERIGTNPDVWDQTFCVQGRGHVYCSAVTETSDISLKENIKDLTNSIDIIKQLRPVKYNLKAEASLEEDERETDFGLIAQEVELILPEVISILKNVK